MSLASLYAGRPGLASGTLCDVSLYAGRAELTCGTHFNVSLRPVSKSRASLYAGRRHVATGRPGLACGTLCDVFLYAGRAGLTCGTHFNVSLRPVSKSRASLYAGRRHVATGRPGLACGTLCDVSLYAGRAGLTCGTHFNVSLRPVSKSRASLYAGRPGHKLSNEQSHKDKLVKLAAFLLEHLILCVWELRLIVCDNLPGGKRFWVRNKTDIPR